MKIYSRLHFCFFLIFSVFYILPTFAAPNIGNPAPKFDSVDSNGKNISLADYIGKIVVLEWTNHDCPYVRRQYETGNMQMTQTKAQDMGVVWMTVISSAPGTQGHVSSKEANRLTILRKAKPKYVLMDQSGAIGKLYRARTTPHMYVLNKKGVLVYNGAIDDDPTSWGEMKPSAKNYVLQALSELVSGKTITNSATQPYGCSVKYGS